MWGQTGRSVDGEIAIEVLVDVDRYQVVRGVERGIAKKAHNSREVGGCHWYMGKNRMNIYIYILTHTHIYIEREKVSKKARVSNSKRSPVSIVYT